MLDVGSGDINGNNNFLFENCEYNGNDVTEAKNVTIVSRTKDLPFEKESFDTIISTECFEHDPEYKESFLKMDIPFNNTRNNYALRSDFLGIKRTSETNKLSLFSNLYKNI
mgnify:CR=1 FL=1